MRPDGTPVQELVAEIGGSEDSRTGGHAGRLSGEGVVIHKSSERGCLALGQLVDGCRNWRAARGEVPVGELEPLRAQALLRGEADSSRSSSNGVGHGVKLHRRRGTRPVSIKILFPVVCYRVCMCFQPKRSNRSASMYLRV